MFNVIHVIFTVHLVTCEHSVAHLQCGKIMFLFFLCIIIKDISSSFLIFMALQHQHCFSAIPALFVRCWADYSCLWCWLWTPRPDHMLIQTASLSDPKYWLFKPDQHCFWQVHLATFCQLIPHVWVCGNQNHGVFYSKNTQISCAASHIQICVHTSFCLHSCNGENSCTVKASNSVFGESCVGTLKYLEVAYVCECK